MLVLYVMGNVANRNPLLHSYKLPWHAPSRSAASEGSFRVSSFLIIISSVPGNYCYYCTDCLLSGWLANALFAQEINCNLTLISSRSSLVSQKCTRVNKWLKMEIPRNSRLLDLTNEQLPLVELNLYRVSYKGN